MNVVGKLSLPKRLFLGLDRSRCVREAWVKTLGKCIERNRNKHE
jgi:hypothetical protein